MVLMQPCRKNQDIIAAIAYGINDFEQETKILSLLLLFIVRFNSKPVSPIAKANMPKTEPGSGTGSTFSIGAAKNPFYY